ncbi:MAG: LytTR family DNA-binding domain-containing protein [Bacteroidota bacterium]
MSQAIRVIVVDDEPPARRKLVSWLSDDEDITVVTTCANGHEALATLQAEEVDVMFLDIQMPQLSGFDVVEQLPANRRPLVVFSTAYDQYAVDAFKLHAIDYLLKPYDHPRFLDTLVRVKNSMAQLDVQMMQQQLSQLLTTLHQPKQSFLKHFTVKRQDAVQLIKVEAVDWIAAEGNYVMLHAGKSQHLIRDNIGKVEASLNPEQFPRIHRSTIINLDRVEAFYPASHGDYTVILQNGTELAMSRTYKNKLRDSLQLGL